MRKSQLCKEVEEEHSRRKEQQKSKLAGPQDLSVKETERRSVGLDCKELRGKWADVRLEVRTWVRSIFEQLAPSHWTGLSPNDFSKRPSLTTIS